MEKIRLRPCFIGGAQVKKMKINKHVILYAILFAAFSLALHFITVYLLCHGTGLLLAGGDMLNSPEKWEIREKAETIMGQAGMLGNLFIASCYLFLLTIGGALVIRKITALEYVMSVLLFCLIQFGIFILERLIDTHGMTELCNRLWAVLHQKAVWILFMLPLLISVGRRIADRAEEAQARSGATKRK